MAGSEAEGPGPESAEDLPSEGGAGDLDAEVPVPAAEPGAEAGVSADASEPVAGSVSGREGAVVAPGARPSGWCWWTV